MKRKEDQILNVISNSLWDLPSPSTITYFWNFGSILGVCLIIQIMRGLLLTFHYTAFASERFSSVVLINRDVWRGWLARFIHINGASVFFLFIYMHIFRGIFYLSAIHKALWISGVLIMVTIMAISFLGYVLPWGQISYWAVAVITNLFSVVPVVGNDLVTWLWGGFSVGAPTLIRFYSLHFLLPFILSALVLTHLILLHKEGSRNRVGVNRNIDKLEFHPYFSIKDVMLIFCVLLLSFLLTFHYPFALGDTVNNVPANPIQTPIHIQPEWYFLPSYAILRALPRKTAGVLALVLSVSIFFLIPMFDMAFSTKFSFYRYIIFWIFLASFGFLIKIGALPAEEPFIYLSKVGAFLYFTSIVALNL